MLQLEVHFLSFSPPFANATQPLPYSVKIIEDQYFILLSLSTAKLEYGKWRNEGNSFACNGVDGAKALPGNKKTQFSLIDPNWNAYKVGID